MKLLATTIASLLAVPFASRAEFEKWTNAQGKVAELELVAVIVGKGAAEFATRSGGKVTIKFAELASKDLERVRSWNPAAKIKSSFLGSSSSPAQNPGRHVHDLWFALAGKNLCAIKEGEIKLTQLRIDGEKKDTANWGGNTDPFHKVPERADRLEFAVGSMDSSLTAAEIARCELDAAVILLVGTEKKEVSGVFKSSEEGEEPELQNLGPLKVGIRPNFSREIGKDGKSVPGTETYSYDVVVAPPYDAQVIDAEILLNGKKLEPFNSKKITGHMKVLIRYWAEVREIPVKVQKKAIEQGRFEMKQPDPFEP